MKQGWIVLAILMMIPLAYSITLKELVAKYDFSTLTTQMNVTDYMDFMTDKNENEVNDTLVFELTTINTAGTFVFVINLLDKNGILTNETNKTLAAGINKVNITFSSLLLSQEQFNYSIKVYNSSRRQKFRKDNILTHIYSTYEEGFRILGVQDSIVDKKLRINVTVNSPKDETLITTLFLSYANQSIFSKGSKAFNSGINNILFDFDNETVKRTHYIGNFSIPSAKIGGKTYKTDFTTSFYNFKDFAASPYIFNFTDNGVDMDSDGKLDFLEINADASILNTGNYILTIALYDLFDELVEIKNASVLFDAGNRQVPIKFNGANINKKKVNGPFVIKSIELYENGLLADSLNDAYTTKNYNFNDFNNPDLPDLSVNITVSDAHKYGINNATINITIKNLGNKHAFNVFADIFDNGTFSKSSKSNILGINSQVSHHLDFTNFSDFEITAIADLQNFVEELNESNNAWKAIIRLNRKPILVQINNLTINETQEILVNLSASDPNGDALTFSINSSKFSNNFNVFEWNTTTNDSGEYILEAAVSDGFLNDSFIFKITILNASGNDADNDGIDDAIDNLIGNEKYVNTSTINLTIFVGNSTDLSRFFNESSRVWFFDANLTITEFSFNFSHNRLNLSNILINKQSDNSRGYLIFGGLNLTQGTKTMYVDRINKKLKEVCIKDSEASAISEISKKCNARDEFKINCNGKLKKIGKPKRSYRCYYNSTTNKYKVEGLQHSGVIQIK